EVRCRTDKRLVDGCRWVRWRAVQLSEIQWHPGEKFVIGGAVPGLVQLELGVEFFLSQGGQQGHAPTKERFALGTVQRMGRKMAAVRLGIVVHGKGKLLEIIESLGQGRRLAH